MMHSVGRDLFHGGSRVEMGTRQMITYTYIRLCNHISHISPHHHTQHPITTLPPPPSPPHISSPHYPHLLHHPSSHHHTTLTLLTTPYSHHHPSSLHHTPTPSPNPCVQLCAINVAVDMLVSPLILYHLAMLAGNAPCLTIFRCVLLRL